MRGSKFSSGKYSWGLCDICSFRYKLHELAWTFVRGKKTGLLACPTCWDPDHPQNFLDLAVTVDPQALKNPRPQTDLEASRRLFPNTMWTGQYAHRPDVETQHAEITDQEIKDSNQKILADWEERQFRWANQRNQRNERNRR